MDRVILFLNGELVGDENFYKDYIKRSDRIVCADGGAKHSFNLGLDPDLILGDLDSIPQNILTYYKERDVQFEKYPAEKDKSDTELILEKLIKEEYKKIIIFAALGGRTDHSLANIYLLDYLSNSNTGIKFITPKEEVEVITSIKVIKDKFGTTISLLPLSDKVTGVSLSGFKYELKNGVLTRGSTLGLSNIIQDKEAKIKINTGKLLIILNNN